MMEEETTEISNSSRSQIVTRLHDLESIRRIIVNSFQVSGSRADLQDVPHHLPDL
jgi:hypothetical protein